MCSAEAEGEGGGVTTLANENFCLIFCSAVVELFSCVFRRRALCPSHLLRDTLTQPHGHRSTQSICLSAAATAAASERLNANSPGLSGGFCVAQQEEGNRRAAKRWACSHERHVYSR